MKIGIELECVLNTQRITALQKGGYHMGERFNDYWEAQDDSSISTQNVFDMEEVVEFVSKPLNNQREMVKALKSLRIDLNKNRKKKLSLHKLMSVNSSCGAHIHFSNGKFKYWDKASPVIFPKVREYFFKILDDNKKISQETKNSVKNQYDRYYANNLSENAMRQHSNRRVEWNFCSELSGRGMEWRSFNVNGVKTWVELISLFKLGYKSILYLEKLMKRWEENEEEILEFEEKTMKKKRSRVVVYEEDKDDEEVDVEVM